MLPAGMILEIVVVGLLFLVAVHPLILLLASLSLGELLDLIAWRDGKGAGAFLIIALAAYAIGIAGNRLSDDFFERLLRWRFARFLKLRRLRSKRWNNRTLAEAAGAGLYGHGSFHRHEVYKIAEFALMGESAATAAWLNRHKSFIRILRGGSFAALLALGCAAFYTLLPMRSDPYSWRYFAGTALVFIVFHLCWRLETYGYKRRVVMLALKDVDLGLLEKRAPNQATKPAPPPSARRSD